jgi:hypothetical protein
MLALAHSVGEVNGLATAKNQRFTWTRTHAQPLRGTHRLDAPVDQDQRRLLHVNAQYLQLASL